MNVSLTPELEKFVSEKVESGMYYSASEVIREGLRLLQEKEMLKQIKIESLRKEIQKGIDSLEEGKGIPLDVEKIKSEGRKRLAKRSQNSEN